MAFAECLLAFQSTRRARKKAAISDAARLVGPSANLEGLGDHPARHPSGDHRSRGGKLRGGSRLQTRGKARAAGAVCGGMRRRARPLSAAVSGFESSLGSPFREQRLSGREASPIGRPAGFAIDCTRTDERLFQVGLARLFQHVLQRAAGDDLAVVHGHELVDVGGGDHHAHLRGGARIELIRSQE